MRADLRSRVAGWNAGAPQRWVSVAAWLLCSTACQQKEEHPSFLPSCEATCIPAPGVVVSTGGAGAPSGGGGADAGPATLTGQVVLLNDSSFVPNSLYSAGATISANGALGSPVTAVWNGADPYILQDLSPTGATWVTVKPNRVDGDALTTIQAVGAGATQTVNLSLISSAALDDVFSANSMLRASNAAQVVLFFRSAGTGVALQGLRVTMAAAQLTSYRAGNGWLLDDGTAVTDQSGLVVFGNVGTSNTGTQTVVITRAATATRPAVPGGQFAVNVSPEAATLAAVNVQF